MWPRLEAVVGGVVGVSAVGGAVGSRGRGATLRLLIPPPLWLRKKKLEAGDEGGALWTALPVC